MDGPSSLAVDLFKLGLSIALAVLSWHLVERPILALKDGSAISPRRRGSPSRAAPGSNDLGSVKVG